MAKYLPQQAHRLEQLANRWYRCTVCQKTWQTRPRTSCVGLRVFNYAQIDWTRLATASSLRRCGLRLSPGQQPAGCYERAAGRPRQVLLYWIEEAQPARRLTKAQQQALQRAREGWRQRLVCSSCGETIEPERRWRRLRICWACEEAQRVRARRQELRAWLREELARDIVVLDTETTGLPSDPGFQVVEIAVIAVTDGRLLFHSLIKPSEPSAMTQEARAIHGISDEDLASAPALPAIWDRLIRLLEGKEAIWGYNADFDRLALVASARRYQLALPTWLVAAERWRCAMSLYREWMGWDWDVSLERACAHEGIPAGWHTAELDARSTLALLRVLAGLEEET